MKVILPTVSCSSDVDMERSTAIKSTCSGNELPYLRGADKTKKRKQNKKKEKGTE